MAFGSLGFVPFPFSVAPWAITTDATIDLDFENNRGFQGATVGTVSQFVNCARVLGGYAEDASGSVLYAFAANVPRITNKGLLFEGAKTNVVLWCRDLTNAAWTKTSVTAALDQTGVDGIATSASSITATAGNGTCLQAITLANSARFQTAWVKRITGSGVVNMTMDNGSTYTAITVTSSWSKVNIPTQTITNPTVGFQIVTNGDAIAVDFVQNENSGTGSSSPILTTTVAVTRDSDVNSFATVPTFGTSFSVFAKAYKEATFSNKIVSFDDDTNKRLLDVQAGFTNRVDSIGAGGVELDATAGSGTWATTSKAAAAYTSSGRTLCMNAGTVASDATTISGIPGSFTTLRIGSSAGSTYLKRLAFQTTNAWTNATLQSITTL